jgi:PilZ domain
MGSDGRFEKRAAVKILVHIVPVESAFNAETTTMTNISRNGARVLTHRRWHPGQQLAIATVTGNFQRQARVIYCFPMIDRRFCVGLEFDTRVNDIRQAAWPGVA